MYFQKKLIHSLSIAAFSLLSIESVRAEDMSTLKMSFSEPKISVSQAEDRPKPQSEQSPVRENSVSQNRSEDGWYFGTVRGSNSMNMSGSLDGQTATWTGADSLGSLFNLTNLTGYATTILKDGTQNWGSQAGFTYQVMGGVGYAVSDQQDIYLQYKFSNPPAQLVDSSDELLTTVLNSNNLEIGTRFRF